MALSRELPEVVLPIELKMSQRIERTALSGLARFYTLVRRLMGYWIVCLGRSRRVRGQLFETGQAKPPIV